MIAALGTDAASARSGFARLPGDSQRRIVIAVAGLILVTVAGPVVMAPNLALHWLAVALAGVLLFAQPHLAILLVFLLLGLRLSPVQIGPLSTPELIAAPLVFLLALQVLRDREIWMVRVPHVRLLLGIAAVLLAATGWSLMMHPDPPTEAVAASWAEQTSFFRNLLLLFMFVYFIKTPRQLGHAVAMFLLMILLLAADGLDLFGVESDGARAQAAYFGGFAGNNNRLAFLCVWGTALVWALRFKGPAGWWQRLTLVPLIALPFTTLMTGSRSGLIQLLVLGGLILLEQRHWAPGQRARAVALMAAVAVVIVVATPAALVDRASNLDVGGPSTIDRIQAFRDGALMVVENPLFGVGPGNFVWRKQLMSGYAMSQHNSYLWAITTGGPLMLFLYVALFYRTYRTLRAVERWGTGPFVWLATALRFKLITFLLFSFFATVWHVQVFWLLIGLTVAVARIAGGRPPLTPPLTPPLAGPARGAVR